MRTPTPAGERSGKSALLASAAAAAFEQSSASASAATAGGKWNLSGFWKSACFTRSLQSPRGLDEPTPLDLTAEYDFARAIWLPEPREPVTLFLGSGQKVPGRVVERDGGSVLVAALVPVERARNDLDGVMLEHTNPCGRVRLTGEVSLIEAEGGLLLRLDDPDLVEVVQDREYVRVDVECPLQLVKGAEQYETSTVDVSAGGLLLADELGLQLGDELDVDLTIAPGAAPVLATAKVVRFDAQGRPAVEFGSISDTDRWRLLRFTLDRVRVCARERLSDAGAKARSHRRWMPGAGKRSCCVE